MILDIVLVIMLSLFFTDRMLEFYSLDKDSFALLLFGVGTVLAIIEMKILRGYIKSYSLRGLVHIRTVTYLVISLPLIVIVAFPINNPSDVLFIPILMLSIWLPVYLLLKIFKPIIETSQRNNSDANS